MNNAHLGLWKIRGVATLQNADECTAALLTTGGHESPDFLIESCRMAFVTQHAVCVIYREVEYKDRMKGPAGVDVGRLIGFSITHQI